MSRVIFFFSFLLGAEELKTGLRVLFGNFLVHYLSDFMTSVHHAEEGEIQCIKITKK